MEETVSPRQLVKTEAKVHAAPEDRKKAYDLWRSGGLTLAAVAARIGVHARTVKDWSTSGQWVARRARDEAVEQRTAVARARQRASRRVDRDMANVEAIADAGEKDAIRLQASKLLLTIAGVTDRTPVKDGATGTSHLGPLSDDDLLVIEALFREETPGG